MIIMLFFWATEPRGPIESEPFASGRFDIRTFCKCAHHTDIKENQIFLINKEIQNGAVAKSYMTNGLLMYGEIFAHFLIY
jgi:hypothetical protein